ncbi:MAG: M48 family metallopeptidase [Thiolinea sp.]
MAAISEDDFIALVRKAEQDAATSPQAYTLKLALFAVLGYLVIFLVLAALIGLTGGLFGVALLGHGIFLLLLKTKLLFAAIPAIWLLLRALWVKFEPPQGHVLKRKDYPALFAELDALSRELKSLKIHEVILDKRLNAAVVQHPRLGLLGWQKNYLILGYQLLLTLSVEEMRSVLAHELGHLSGNHSRFGGWIYRVRRTWGQVMASFSQAQSWGSRLLGRFFDWYSPRFDAYSFVLARRNEYEADSIAARLTSPEIASRALVSVYVTEPYLEENYWPGFYRDADEYDKPQYQPLAGLSHFVATQAPGQDKILQHIRQAMSVETHYADTHPSLKDRLAALGAAPQVPTAPAVSAAEAWLGAGNRQVMEMLDQEWLGENLESWQQRHAYVSNARQHLQAFAQVSPDMLDDPSLWNYAWWTHDLVSREQAIPLFQAYQARHPQDPDTAYFIGMHQLQQNDPAGLDQLRLARKCVPD